MQVHELYGSRFQLALDLLQAGDAFSYQDVSFWLAPDGCLEVSVRTSWRIENTTTRTAMDDLERAKNLVNDLVAKSPTFATIAKAHPQRFILIHDYGTGSVELCRLLNGTLTWAKGMPFATDTE